MPLRDRLHARSLHRELAALHDLDIELTDTGRKVKLRVELVGVAPPLPSAAATIMASAVLIDSAVVIGDTPSAECSD